jgi:hypothetical protein
LDEKTIFIISGSAAIAASNLVVSKVSFPSLCVDTPRFAR